MEPDGALLQLHPPAQHSRLRAIRCTPRQGLRISPARSPTVLGPPPAPSTDHIGAHSANPLGWLVESNPRHLTDNSCPRSTPSCASRRRTASLRPEALLPLARAPSRKPLARATATKAFRLPRSIFTVRFPAQPVRIVPDYRQPWRRLSVPRLERRS